MKGFQGIFLGVSSLEERLSKERTAGAANCEGSGGRGLAVRDFFGAEKESRELESFWGRKFSGGRRT